MAVRVIVPFVLVVVGCGAREPLPVADAGDSGPADAGDSGPVDAEQDPDASDVGPGDADLISDVDLDGPSDGDSDPDTDEVFICPRVIINEVVSDNHDSLEDGDGDSSDWIELYNASGTAISLAGWTLSEDLDRLDPWTFPETELEPGGFLVVFASGKGLDGPPGELHTDFRVSASGEALVLGCPGGGLADSLTIPALGEDLSYGPSQLVRDMSLIQPGDTALLRLDPDEGWIEPGVDESGWTEVVLGVGFDGIESDVDPVNVALLALTDQSSHGYSRTGAQAVDGDLSTFSHTADGDLDPWWQVDLTGLWSVSAVRLHNRRGCCPERLYNLTVTLLDGEDAVVWTSDLLNPVAEGDAPTDPGEMLELVLEEPVVAARVRVAKHAVNGPRSSEWMSLAEVEVLGVEASPYTSAIATDLSEVMRGVTARAGLRAWVPLPDGPADRALLRVAYDDGFADWLDGHLLAGANLGIDQALADHSGQRPEVFALDPGFFLGGEGLLAFEVQNVAASDDDLLLSPELVLQWIEQGEPAYFSRPTPGEPNGEGWLGVVAAPEVDRERGFYDLPFTVRLRCPTPGAALVYTTDGSTPRRDGTLRVEPSRAEEVAAVDLLVETTTVLRAAAYLEGWGDSPAVAQTYVFLQDVIRQPNDPPGLPATWDGMSQPPVAADYEMDPDVVDDPAYHDDLLTGLQAIPTLSVSLDPEDLFGAEDGIYIHTLQRGDRWERPASVELIEVDGSGFQEHCGLRIHGYGWRSHSNTRKHSFRLEFRSEYGPRRLEYPLFPDSPAERFDSIVLRSQGSRGWQDFRDPEQSQYLRDAFARDTARDMGKVDGHGRHVHLYLNGLYWGLYQMVERPDAGFAAEYFGGDADEYDAVNRRTTTNEAINGDLEAYNALLALADRDVTDPEVWTAIQDMLDVDDLIDYMLIHQYTVNRDGPCCFSHNNMRGARRRVDWGRWRFFVWDMEYSIWNATDDTNIDVDVPGAISHVYARLRGNADFRARYAERAAMHLRAGGALTAEACTARWEARSAEIFDAVVAESARWGDAARATPYTRDVVWMAERRRLLEEFFPHRSAHLEEQLIAAGLMEP